VPVATQAPVDVPAERLDPLPGALAEELRAHLLEHPGRGVLLAEHVRRVVRRVPGGHRGGVGRVERTDQHAREPRRQTRGAAGVS